MAVVNISTTTYAFLVGKYNGLHFNTQAITNKRINKNGKTKFRVFKISTYW